MNDINKKIIFAVVTLFLLSLFVCVVSADDNLNGEREVFKNEIADIAFENDNPMTDLTPLSTGVNSVTGKLNNISPEFAAVSAKLIDIAQKSENLSEYPTSTPAHTVTPVITETIEPTSPPEDNTFGTVLIFIIIVAAAVVIIVTVIIIINKKKLNLDDIFDALSSRFAPKHKAQAKTYEIEPAVFKEPEENESDVTSVEDVTSFKAPLNIEKEEEKKTEYSLNDPNIPLIEIYNLVAGKISKRYGIKNISSLTPRQMISLVNEPTSELKEFSALYEKMKYSLDSEPQDRNRLKSLAETILKQYRP